MGLYNYVHIEDGLKMDLPAFEGDLTRAHWQTKTFSQPRLDVYKITIDGQLFEEEAYYESVPEDERPEYTIQRVVGSKNRGRKRSGVSGRSARDGRTPSITACSSSTLILMGRATRTRQRSPLVSSLRSNASSDSSVVSSVVLLFFVPS